MMQDTPSIDSPTLCTQCCQPVFLLTNIVKDHDGKTVVITVANVETDVLEDENDSSSFQIVKWILICASSPNEYGDC